MSGQAIENEGNQLSLTQKEKEYIDHIVQLAVVKIAELAHPCRFNTITDEDAKEFGHIVGMYKDVGDNNLARGIEQIRDNHNIVKAGRKVSRKVWWGVVAASAGVVGTFVTQHFFHLFNMGVK